jgi:hypothetical protein
MDDQNYNESLRKTFGILKKITLDKSTFQLKNDKPLKYENAIEYNKSLTKFYYFELNLYELTFSYKEKPAEPVFKRSYGYKQVFKYTLQLNEDENKLINDEYQLGFKVYLENKCMILFCRNIFDLKMWIGAFQFFFEKKTHIMQDVLEGTILSKKILISNNNTNHNLLSQSESRKLKNNEEDYLELKNLVNRLIENNTSHFRTNTVYDIVKQFKKLKKSINEYEVIQSNQKMINEMKDEWSFFFNEDKHKKSNTKYKLLEQTPNKNRLLFSEKKRENIDILVNTTDITDYFLEKQEGKMKLEEIDNNYLKKNKYTFIDGFQNFSKENAAKIIENEKEEKLKSVQQQIEIFKKETQENGGAENNQNEIMNNENKTADFEEKENFFLFEIENEKQVNRNGMGSMLTVFPKTHEQIGEISYEKQDSIDNNHMKWPQSQKSISISIEQTQENYDTNIKKSFSIVESPHFGNIAIIAQRFNKIDNLDDWKAYIDK